MSSPGPGIRFAATLALLVAAAAPGRADGPRRVALELPDGRVLHGGRLIRREQSVVLETPFGSLEVPRAVLEAPPPEIPASPDGRWKKVTRWFVIESDLAPPRAAVYADELDAFFDWLIGNYGLDRSKVKAGGPYGIFIYRRREDFKKVQEEVAPGIEGQKGKGFAEGVAGFHGGNGTYLWDADAEYGSINLEVGKHEVTHLLNSVFARLTGTPFPVWIEEGTATYFEFAVTFGGREPEDNPAALALVLRDLGAGNAMGSRALREVPYETFYGREYSWGWALVRFLRHYRGGTRWGRLLAFLQDCRGIPDPARRSAAFLKAVGFKSEEKFDAAWREHLEEAGRALGSGLPGASDSALAEVEAIAVPSVAQARTFARYGEAFARRRINRAAVVYLRAAIRGGLGEARFHRLLAEALAYGAGLAVDEPWPEEALGELRAAVALDPLRAALRRDLGLQLLARASTAEETRAARDMLALALMLAGNDDDRPGLSLAALRGAAADLPESPPRAAAENLKSLLPEFAGDLDHAVPYFLQEEEEWDELLTVLRERRAGGGATFEERVMLAGLLLAADGGEEAVGEYRSLLGEQPEAHHLRPALIAALVSLDRLEEARAEKEEALLLLGPRDPATQSLRRRILRIEIP